MQIGVNDEKFLAMKKKYEETVKHLEDEISKYCSTCSVRIQNLPDPAFSKLRLRKGKG
jgi:hypothetical protein